jgi:acetylornithine deacetylase/succinyl-diaminopimelate desuccinylase-like protein
VAIPSVSATAEYRDEVFKMIDWTEQVKGKLESEKMEGYLDIQLMIKLNISCTKVENGMQIMPDGSTIKLPPILFGTLGNDKNKRTLLIYGHLDVQPAQIEDGWFLQQKITTKYNSFSPKGTQIHSSLPK